MFILAISALAATLNNKRGIEYPGNSLKDAPATLKHKRESVVGILYPSEIKNFQVEQCHVPSLFPTPLCEKTYVSELLGSNVVPAQPDVSPYTGFVYFCVLKVDNYVVVKGEWKHKIKYSKIIYKIDIPDIINVVEIRLYVGEAGKRGLPVANLIKPNAAPNNKKSYFKTGTVKDNNLFHYTGNQQYSLKDVARAIERGVAYVSVNTDSGFELDPAVGNYIYGEIRGQTKRDCGSKCTCGINALAVNAIGDPISTKAGLNDLYRGVQ